MWSLAAPLAGAALKSVVPPTLPQAPPVDMPAPDIPALVQQLRSRRAPVQISAAYAIARMAESGSANLNDAIAAAGGVHTLVPLLGSGNEALQAAAAVAIGNLTLAGEVCRRSIVEAGAVESTVRLLGGGAKDALAVGGIAALQNLSFSGGARSACSRIAAAGGIDMLVQLLRGSDDTRVASSAAGVLANVVCGNPAFKDAAAGAIPQLVGQLGSADAQQRCAAPHALRNLVAGHAANSRAAEQQGAVAALAAHARSSNLMGRTEAMEALGNILVNIGPEACTAHAAQLAAAGTVHALAEQLRSRNVPLQHAAAGVADALARHAAGRSLLVAEQATAPLVSLLGPAADASVCSRAASALAGLVQSTDTHDAVLASGAARPLVQLLQRSDSQSADATNAVGALGNLTCSSSGCEAVAAAHGVQPMVPWLLDSSCDSPYAAAAVAGLCNLSLEHGRLVVAAGGLKAAARLLSSSGDSLTKVYAAHCMHNVAVSQPAAVDAQAAAKCAAAMVTGALNGPFEVSVAAVRAFAAVCRSNAGNRQAVRSVLQQLLQEGSLPRAAVVSKLLQNLQASEESDPSSR